ncbi:hypothetical protein ABK040_012665 [Willaertia magna]
METYQPLRDENTVVQQQPHFDPQHQQFVVPQQQPYMIYNPHVIPQPVYMYPPMATPNNTPVTSTTIIENPMDAERMKQDENNSLLFLVLGFFIGICWIVSYILYRNSPSSVARRNAKIGLILFVSILVITLASFGFFFVFFFLSLKSAFVL